MDPGVAYSINKAKRWKIAEDLKKKVNCLDKDTDFICLRYPENEVSDMIKERHKIIDNFSNTNQETPLKKEDFTKNRKGKTKRNQKRNTKKEEKEKEKHKKLVEKAEGELNELTNNPVVYFHFQGDKKKVYQKKFMKGDSNYPYRKTKGYNKKFGVKNPKGKKRNSDHNFIKNVFNDKQGKKSVL